MKRLLITTLTLLVATIFAAAIPTEAEAAIFEDTVRLHILAASDSREDQELKLALRDAVLEKYGKSLSVFESAGDAKESLKERIDEIEEFVNAWLLKNGSPYEANITLSEEWYETRDYGDFTLPKGYYTSLRIIIGEGEGQNWWCVMFPPLCLDAATESSAYTSEETLLITKRYTLKFKFLELISEITK